MYTVLDADKNRERKVDRCLMRLINRVRLVFEQSRSFSIDGLVRSALLTFCMLIALQGSSQSNYRFESLGVNENLPHSDVLDIIQGPHGFMWIAATFLDLAGLTAEEAGMEPMEGRSLTNYFKPGEPSDGREFMLLGKERHDLGRPKDVGYPIRGILKDDFLYLRNFKTERWPAGNPETGYTNTDGSPTKSYILDLRRNGVDTLYWEQNFGKRPYEELYNISVDEDCIVNLAEDPDYKDIKTKLSELMESELRKQNDPRILGNGDVFDNYPPHRGAGFYERYMSGEEVNSGWINDSDFEKNESQKK